MSQTDRSEPVDLGGDSSSRPVAFDDPAGRRAYSGAGVAADEGRTIRSVEVVPELCMNFLNCMRIATGAFATDRASGKTHPTERWRSVDQAKLWRAGWSCPSGAIRFITDDGYVNPRWEEAARWNIERHPAAGLRREAPSDAR